MLFRNTIRDDKNAIHHILEATGVFTHEEVRVALELIDIFLNDPDQTDYIIRSGVGDTDDVVGYYCIGPTPMTLGTYDLYWIAVKPEVHSRGIGRQLLGHAEQLVALNGGRLLIAETSSQPKYDTTRRFYVTNGYQEVARIKDYYRIDDDLVIYGKYFPQLGAQ